MSSVDLNDHLTSPWGELLGDKSQKMNKQANTWKIGSPGQHGMMWTLVTQPQG